MSLELLLAVVLCALAGYRISRFIAQDTLTDNARTRIYEKSFSPELVHPTNKGWAFIYGLVSCPHCVGVWITGLVFLVYALAVDLHISVWAQLIGAGAAMGIQSYMASKAVE